MATSKNPIIRFGKWLKFKICPQDIYESIRPMIWIFLLLGVLPLRISGSRGNYQLKIVYIGYLTALVMLIIMFFSYTFTIYLDRIFLAYFLNHPFSAVVDRVLITSTLLGMILVYSKNIRRSYGFVRIIKRLDCVDQLLKSIGERMSYGHATLDILLRLLNGTLFFAIYVIGSFYLLSMQGWRTHLTTWISYFLPHMLLMLVLFRHQTVMHLLVNRFAKLSKVSTSISIIYCY